MVPFAIFRALLSTVNTAQLTKAAPADTGTIVAIDMSVGSAVGVLSPSLATHALARIGYSSIGGFGFAVTTLLALLMQTGTVDANPLGSRKIS